MGDSRQRHPIHTFDIDTYLNHVVPRPRFHLLPQPVSHWFGYRPLSKGEKSRPRAKSVPLVWLFSFIGAFIGIAIHGNVFRNLPHLDGAPVPVVIVSFGAAAILEYNTIESPLSQPRNMILGQVIAAAIGVSITKLFLFLPEARFTELQWLAGALSVGAASSVMGMTNTVHPPAGATALMAATNSEIMALGWWLIVLVLLAAVLMLVSAMLVNNLYSRFPLYWWTPADLSKLHESKIVQASNAEKGEAESDSSMHTSSDTGSKEDALDYPTRKGNDTPYWEHDDSPLDRMERQQWKIHNDPEVIMKIETDRIVVPDWMQLSRWEAGVLQSFQKKLREQSRGEKL